MDNLKEKVSMTVTSLSDLQNYSKGKIVQLPDFGDDQPFVARVTRPSMLVLAKNGKIPNSLLGVANQLFVGHNTDIDNPAMLADLYDVCRVIAESTLLEPTLEDIENAGLRLTDEQLMALFNYSQVGVKALEPFRKN